MALCGVWDLSQFVSQSLRQASADGSAHSVSEQINFIKLAARLGGKDQEDLFTCLALQHFSMWPPPCGRYGGFRVVGFLHGSWLPKE